MTGMKEASIIVRGQELESTSPAFQDFTIFVEQLIMSTNVSDVFKLNRPIDRTTALDQGG